ncbi:DUF4446 family protein [Paenibacillus sp. N3.4]|uniref:DUF4446 family protein n=1 Tax=Paenibacillus sp. N3.4 TaxID=2603222 RepID=UPI0011CCA832|nr:DUF4446 family protein [Paenibacillus sp. N3.4]TXK77747.1 DUF4446 family protein [Paenibacillus sp. N3.4]
MGEMFGIDGGLIVLICLALIIVLFVCILILFSKLSSLRKQYVRMINGSQADNMEELIITMQNAINMQKAESVSISAQVDRIREVLTKMKSKVAIHRYNAFGDRGGSDMSFTIAILDEYQDGVILTGIHSREQTYLYAKPIVKGQSNYSLSPEEKEAINQTLKQP